MEGIDPTLKVMFRKQELEARQRRREDLMRRVRNEIILGKEPLTDEERDLTNIAYCHLSEMNELHWRETHRYEGYWKKLWLAIWGAL